VRATIGVSGCTVWGPIGGKIGGQGPDATNEQVFGQFCTRYNQKAPYVEPILDMGWGRDGKKVLQSLRGVADEGVRVHSQDGIAFRVKQLHLGTEAAMSGLILCLEAVPMNGLIPVGPQTKEGRPNCCERTERPVCSRLRSCTKLVVANVGVLEDAPLAG
jgi:hypothetical protein